MGFVVVDIETTGLSRERDRITEIAAARIIDGEIVEEFQTLVNPERPIPSFITKLTGITDEMVRTAPPIQTILPQFREFLGDDVIVAHNAGFDCGFLQHNFLAHLQCTLANETLCTRKLANRLLPDLPSKRLGHVCEHFDIRNEQAHRALGDVRATSMVLSKYCELLHACGLHTPEDILRIERAPCGKARELLG